MFDGGVFDGGDGGGGGLPLQGASVVCAVGPARRQFTRVSFIEHWPAFSHPCRESVCTRLCFAAPHPPMNVFLSTPFVSVLASLLRSSDACFEARHG